MSELSRRSFLRAGAAGVATLPWLLDACGNAASSGGLTPANGSGSKSSAVTPAYLPFTGLKPDLPGTDTVPPAFFNYPKDLVRAVPQAPGKGGDVSALTFTLFAPPPAVDQNPAWQAVNKALNANVKFTIVPVGDYNTRVAATMASGDIPDIFVPSGLGSPIQGEPDFLNQVCADLTPYLNGDNIKAYPNLANFPPYSWPQAIFNGKIYFVPLVKGGVGGPALHYKGRYLDEAGIDATKLTTADAYMQAMKTLTHGNQYGIGWNPLQWFCQVFGAPNNWRNDGGKLTKDLETPEFKDAVAYVRSMWDAGVMHPDSPTLNRSTGAQAWYKGAFCMIQNGFSSYQFVYNSAIGQDPNFKPRVLPVFSEDGKGRAIYYFGIGGTGLVVLKKASTDRVQELLGILTYLAAPFGSIEQTLVSFGVKGTDYTLDDKGSPRATKQGTADVSVPWNQLVTYPDVIYNADDPAYAQVAYDAEKEAYAHGINDPVRGLYSKTFVDKGAVLTQKFTDGINQILFGRANISTYDQLVADWKSGGGDQIRTEFQQALQSPSS
ncbi:MAG: extracellular solute-binding protein [Chloroflexi bacterium]|nr:extracellular solute-binding protein [Chloroflexota bacterium]